MTDKVIASSNSSSEKYHHSIDCGGKILDLSHPQVMGVLNITPDSFSDGGSVHEQGCPSVDKALTHVEQMLAEGASIIDVGGESTRPGASVVTEQEEIDRVLPIVEAVNQRFDTVISVDTSSPRLMTEAAKAGAGLLNDVRAFEKPGALNAAISSGLPVCIMHMRGAPQTMQVAPSYPDVVQEVTRYLARRVQECVKCGLNKNNVIVDPGFGFGKTVEHNLVLLNRLSEVAMLGYPVLVGLSRKSLIGEILGRKVGQRLAGSLALATLALSRGASIIRVHDVMETVDAVRMCHAVIKESP
ncbi:MAG: dihydropteroate synthase [Spongiibacteraceae bacterium]|nr:dihydropteroate synthase [Spongiibacteraceae bacterium]